MKGGGERKGEKGKSMEEENEGAEKVGGSWRRREIRREESIGKEIVDDIFNCDIHRS